MSVFDFLFLLVIAAGAFYAGYQTGRASALTAERDEEDAAPRGEAPLPGPGSIPARRRGDLPGGVNADASAPAGGGLRRTATKPPPAAAGLLDKGKDKG